MTTGTRCSGEWLATNQSHHAQLRQATLVSSKTTGLNILRLLKVCLETNSANLGARTTKPSIRSVFAIVALHHHYDTPRRIARVRDALNSTGCWKELLPKVVDQVRQ